MSWLRRFLLLAGLVTGAWLLGSSGQAQADVRVEIDQLKVELELPVVEVAVQAKTGLAPRPEAPRPPAPDQRTETPRTPVVPQQQAPKPPVSAQPPVQAEAPEPQTPPTDPQPVPQQPQPQPQPQPQAEHPINGTLPQGSGAGQTGGNQVPAGTLPAALRPPTTTTSLVSTEQQDAPRIVRSKESTFSPD